MCVLMSVSVWERPGLPPPLWGPGWAVVVGCPRFGRGAAGLEVAESVCIPFMLHAPE